MKKRIWKRRRDGKRQRYWVGRKKHRGAIPRAKPMVRGKPNPDFLVDLQQEDIALKEDKIDKEKAKLKRQTERDIEKIHRDTIKNLAKLESIRNMSSDPFKKFDDIDKKIEKEKEEERKAMIRLSEALNQT